METRTCEICGARIKPTRFNSTVCSVICKDLKEDGISMREYAERFSIQPIEEVYKDRNDEKGFGYHE